MAHTNRVARGGSSVPVQADITADSTAPPTRTTASTVTLIPGVNVVTTSSSDDDAVCLPKAEQGLVCTIINSDSAQDIEIWPFGDAVSGDTVNGADNTHDATALGEGETRTYVAISDTEWVTLRTGAPGTA